MGRQQLDGTAVNGMSIHPEYGFRNGRRTHGFTLLELTLAITLLVIGITAVSRLTIGLTRAANMTRETELATEAARTMLERIQAESFSQAFRSFNALGSDDPGGPNTAPGASFAVAGLRAAPGDPNGLPGAVVFPTPAGLPGQLREDVTNPKLGMPCDLNGDGVIDSADHSTNYKLLPVLVRVRWQASDGSIGTVELKTIMADY